MNELTEEEGGATVRGRQILATVRRRVPGRSARALIARLFVAAATTVLLFGLPVALAGAGAGAGTPPPEWVANSGAWPSQNFDLSNTRADFDTRIHALDVAT